MKTETIHTIMLVVLLILVAIDIYMNWSNPVTEHANSHYNSFSLMFK